MSEQRRYGVIVDAFSTGAELAPALARYGVRCVHLLQHDLKVSDRFRPADFEAQILHGGDLAATVAALAPFAPEFVVAGSEWGVLLADAVSEALGLVTNGTELSAPRRNKARLAERLAACGLQAVPFFEVRSPEEAASAARSFGEWPVVVKPVDSVATEGLRFCDDEAAVHDAAAALLGRVNFMLSVNESVLVQKRMVGQQYFVLAVSREGRHYISEMWRDDRRRVAGAGVMPGLDVLLPADGEVQAVLRRYVCACLDAVGIRFGPSALEVIMTSDGPVVIDLAARMMGSQNGRVMEAALGASQITLTAACYADPKGFDALAERPYRLRRHVWAVWLHNERWGRLRDASWRDKLASLPSFQSALRTPSPGDILRPTIDESNAYGVVYLMSSDPEELARDYQAIRDLEASEQLFCLEPLSEAEIASLREALWR
jgi:biotin carboxylase